MAGMLGGLRFPQVRFSLWLLRAYSEKVSVTWPPVSASGLGLEPGSARFPAGGLRKLLIESVSGTEL